MASEADTAVNTDAAVDTDTAVDSGSAVSTGKKAEAAENDRAASDADFDDDDLVEEGEIAGDYLEQLLDILDFDGDIDLDVEGDRAVVSIDGGDDLTKLVGRKGEVLDALQELTRLAVQQSTGERSRLMLDIAGWRAGLRAELTRLGTDTANQVAETGERVSLRPMSPFERKIVHDAVAAVAGVTSESEGAEPSRRVVVVKQ
ncbi:R3H domain-containing nucleic acid-binding protein [Rhodococcus sp. HNM0569]|uniref:Jag family protein n=1 Tax=Rhodococcus sp. HNM0569 TaxID=2716340 RepID=UPI00146BE205|nr:R3H domain-containing nucleic acid-binding protein [Rhodococcus sp. HNM0569]NLU84486.1 KH domain-containing protein [Rhodococcus sp. HNM0569]